MADNRLSELMGLLAKPFHPQDLEWRVGTVAGNGKRATLLAYITARAVQERLDQTLGMGRWQNRYEKGPDGGVLCGIGVLVNTASPGGSHNEWVWRWDGAPQTKVEPIKGGLSAAMKRAAVQWGVGRYLYRLPALWLNIQSGWAPSPGPDGVQVGVNVHSKGKHLGHILVPTLPDWALPPEVLEAREAQAQERAAQERAARAEKEPTWNQRQRSAFCVFIRDLFGGRFTYEHVKRLCLDLGRPKPSAMTSQQRDKLLAWLETEVGTRALEKAHAAVEAEKARDADQDSQEAPAPEVTQ